MKIRFINNDTNIESEDFIQATIDFFYEEYANRYVKKFTGQLPYSTNEICQFLEENAQTLFLIEIVNDEGQILDILINGRLFLINKDVVNNFVRIELRQRSEERNNGAGGAI